ncbi:MAG: SRPBCC family protein [Thermoanaerobaculia bacterium]
MAKPLSWTGSLLAGAGLMYLLDPGSGKRRRALLRDKAVRAGDAAGDAIGTTSRDLRNRAVGVAAQTRALVRGAEVPDEVLAERIRSKLGRVVSHPGSIEVAAREGAVTLSGPVLVREEDDLVSCVSSVRGVRSVENRLEVHEQPGDVPGLQGGAGRPSHRFELLQENWSPAWRLLVGTLGASLASYGLRRRGALGAALVVVGGGLLARSISNMEMKRLLGLGSGRRGFDVKKTFDVNAPVKDVFAFWSNIENFPRIMSHVRRVRDNGQGASHWEVEGPGGVVVEWNAITTELARNQLVAWKSAPGEAIRHSGVVRFEELPGPATRIDIRLTYNPPAGVLGHAVATFFRRDPKQALDDDMVRFKSLIEEGRTTAHGETVTREDVEAAAESAPESAPAPSMGAGSPRPRKTRRRSPSKVRETTY